MSGFEMEIRNEKFVVKWSLYPQKCKTGLFTSWKERERLRKCTKMELLFFNVKYANLWRHCRPRRRGCLTTSYKYTCHQIMKRSCLPPFMAPIKKFIWTKTYITIIINFITIPTHHDIYQAQSWTQYLAVFCLVWN